MAKVAARTLFLERIDGLMVEQVVREEEYSMYSRHVHESFELYILLAGERYYFIDRETFLVRAGMAVMVSPDQIHKTSMAGGSYHDRLLFQMDGQMFLPYMKLIGMDSMEELFRQLNGVAKYSGEDWVTVNHLLGQLKREMEEKRIGYEAVVRMLAVQLLILTVRNRGPRPGDAAGLLDRSAYQAMTPKHRTIRLVTEYLLSHCETNESQTELARRFYVSKSYLSRIFREVTGVTLNEYRNLARITEAKRLLAETGLPVTEIAARVGFESITYFERVFKKHTDERPLRYRKTYTAEHKK